MFSSRCWRRVDRIWRPADCLADQVASPSSTIVPQWSFDQLGSGNGRSPGPISDSGANPIDGPLPYGYLVGQHSGGELVHQNGRQSHHPNCRPASASAGHAATQYPCGPPHRDPLCRVAQPPRRHGIPIFRQIPPWIRERHPIQNGFPISNLFQFCVPSVVLCPDALVAAHHPDVRDEFLANLDSSWAQVAHATVDRATRATSWKTGAPGAGALVSTSSSLESHRDSEFTCSWLLLPESVLDLFVAANKSDVNPLPQPCAMLPKPLFWPATETPDSPSTAPI